MRKEIVLVSMIALSGCANVPRSVGVVRIEDLDSPPKAVSQPLMEYTEVWHRSRIEAQATVALTIQEDGSVADVAVVRATNPEIGRAAVESVKKWRFEPPTSRGVPARVALKIPIVSDLENTKFIMP
jgi:TonB family protein